jgi:hypothetical protein
MVILFRASLSLQQNEPRACRPVVVDSLLLMTLNFSTVINQQPFPVSIFIFTGGMKGGQKFSTHPLELLLVVFSLGQEQLQFMVQLQNLLRQLLQALVHTLVLEQVKLLPIPSQRLT